VREPPRRLAARLSCRFFDDEVAEIGRLVRRPFRPKGQQLAPIFSGVRPVHSAGLEMQGSAGRVLLTLVGEVALATSSEQKIRFTEPLFFGWRMRDRLLPVSGEAIRRNR
jgi:hypothetical protein